jgi:hypothetical protein
MLSNLFLFYEGVADGLSMQARLILLSLPFSSDFNGTFVIKGRSVLLSAKPITYTTSTLVSRSTGLQFDNAFVKLLYSR